MTSDVTSGGNTEGTAGCVVADRNSAAARLVSGPSSAGSCGNGQGKRATTILADQGDIVTVITDVPYVVRSRHVPPPHGRGTRAMHGSTLRIPTHPHTDYGTTNQKNYTGSRALGPPDRPYMYPSTHRSQIRLGKELADWTTGYQHTFVGKDVQTPGQIHLPSFENRLQMTQGSGVKTVMDAPDQGNAYWTQYGRVHNKLGVMLGPGVSRERVNRTSYNPLTGDVVGPAWQEDNKRLSGNRVLYHGHRRNVQGHFVLG